MKVNVPELQGFPTIGVVRLVVGPRFMVKQSARAPLTTLKVYGETPPVSVIVWLYATPFAPFVSPHGFVTPAGVQMAVENATAGWMVIVAVAVTDVSATDVAVNVTLSAADDGSAVGAVKVTEKGCSFERLPQPLPEQLVPLTFHVTP